MKERQRQMLRYLLINKNIILMDKLAKTFSIGRRTVSRDLDILDHWLSIRGARLERKQNHGIRVLGFSNSLENLLEMLNEPVKHIETLSPLLRQRQILLYLLYHNREVKITELSGAFFISDTSVWNDLNHIEKQIQNEKFHLERLKGVGIRLLGDEISIRLYFLTLLTETFSAKTIIPYLYRVKEDIGSSLEVNQFKLLMKRMNIPESSSRISELIDFLNSTLGYHFTISGEALLYFYFQLTLHRIKSSALINDEINLKCIKSFYVISNNTLEKLVDNIYCGKIQEGEIKTLALLIQILEIGDLGTVRTNDFKEIITKKIKNLTAEMIKEFSRIDNRMYYLNEHIDSVINLALATLILRLKYKIPHWYGDWGNASGEDWKIEEKENVLLSIIKKQFNLTPTRNDVDNILLHFHSLVINKDDIPKHKIRTLVCCFEGIGLASYLKTILQRKVKSLKIVEATAVYKVNQEYIDNNDIEIVISTYPIININIPVIKISLPINNNQLIDEINRSIIDLKNPKPAFKELTTTKKIILEESISFDMVIDFIHEFNMFTFDEEENSSEIISQLSNRLTKNSNEYTELSTNFNNREDLGPLYFEEYGIRVLHCKSSTTRKPLAGVIKFNNNSQRIIYMVAPNPCSNAFRKLLSTITISFLENNLFRKSIMSGEMNSIRKNLMDIYKELL